MKSGDLVKVHARGKSVFTIDSIDEGEGTAILTSVIDAPGSYPWSAPLATLVPADGE